MSLSGTSNKSIKKRAMSIAGDIFRYLLLLSIGYVILYPMLYLITISFRPDTAFLDPSRVWIPKAVTLERFAFAAKVMDYFHAFMSTVRTELVAAALEVMSCAVVGYGFARFDFPFKGLFKAVLFITILVPSPMIVIPQVLNFSQLDAFGILGLVNRLCGVDLRLNIMGTPLTFYLPSVLASGLRAGILIYIYMQFFSGFPKELEEAAWIDGATPTRTFLKIILPSSSVVIITVSLFALIWHWNDYLLSVMYTVGSTPTLAVRIQTLQADLQAHGIFGYSLSQPGAEAYSMAGCLMFILPVFSVYLFLQRFFIESIDRVGITG